VNKGPDRLTLLAFAGTVLLGGLNGTSIGVINKELAPLWGAALRFGLASVVFIALVAWRRAPLPRGRALIGSLLYGGLGFGTAFALVSTSINEAGPGTTQVMLALVPLLTLLLAVGQGLERFRLQSLAGSLIAVAGIGLVFVERLGGHGISLALLGVLAAAVVIAEANVAIKRFPHVHPLANNAVAMGVGALMLLALSVLAGEQWAIPQQAATVVALTYVTLIGSVVVFTLYLYVIDRWTASATSYSFLLMPLVAVVAAAIVVGEPITPWLIAGGVLVVIGVYLGAFAPTRARILPGLLQPRPAAAATATATVEAGDGPPTMAAPNCP
jgi:drug/metabolite transporter (DMT)-like permease